MANGNSVNRGGFNGMHTATEMVGTDTFDGGPGDDQIKGNGNANMINGGGDDDVVIGRRGNDHLVGGDQEDDLSGGDGDDLLVGAIWVDDDGDGGTALATENNSTIDAADSFFQDDYSDDFNAESSFAANDTDTIWLYDDDLTDFDDSGVYDVIDLSDTLDFEDTDFSGTITDEEKEDQLGEMFTYDDGELQTAGNDAEVWFNVFTDEGMTVADTVYVEVDGDQFMSDGSGWDLVA